jgi:hypothetical protein
MGIEACKQSPLTDHYNACVTMLSVLQLTLFQSSDGVREPCEVWVNLPSAWMQPPLTLASTVPLSSAIGTGPYALESVELLRLSPCNQT